MVWRWIEQAILWQVCLVGVLPRVDSTTVFHGARHALSQEAGVFTRDIDEYQGPEPKVILPFLAIRRDVKCVSQQCKLAHTAILPDDSDIVKAHAANWENVSKGKVHHVYSRRGPNGSLGVDPILATRHHNRTRRIERPPETDEQQEKQIRDKSGETRFAEVYPRPPPNACLDLTNLRHTTHVIDAYVGTPPQRFMPMLDTGSTNTWVVDHTCDLRGYSNSLKYDPSKSATFRKAPDSEGYVRVKFVSGDVIGKLGIDNFSMGGVTVKDQTFAMLMRVPDETTRELLKSTHFSGMIGLAFPNLMVSNSEPLYERYLKTLNAAPIFSFYYSNRGANSAVMFGGADRNFHKSKIRMMPVIGDSYWQVSLQEVWVGDRKVCCDGPAYAIFDTGTTFNSMPYDAFTQLLNTYPFTECNQDNIKERISTMPTIKYVFTGGIEATLKPEQYTFLSNGMCKPAYMQINVHVSDGPGYILGSMGFMPHYYTVYQGGDHPMVGIAPADHEGAAAIMAKRHTWYR